MVKPAQSQQEFIKPAPIALGKLLLCPTMYFLVFDTTNVAFSVAGLKVHNPHHVIDISAQGQ